MGSILGVKADRDWKSKAFIIEFSCEETRDVEPKRGEGGFL